MVLDFGEIKNGLTKVVHDPYDHRLLLWEDDELVGKLPHSFGVVVVPVIPTAEELARLFYNEVQAYLLECCGPFAEQLAWLSKIEVWETPTSLATYNGPVE